MKTRSYFIIAFIIALITLALVYGCICLQIRLYWSTGILSAAITLASILCGFDAVHKNSLLTIDSELMKSIRQAGYISDIIFSMRVFSCISILFIVLSLCYIVFFCKDLLSENGIHQAESMLSCPVAFVAWLFLLVYMIVIFMIIHKLFDDIIEKGCSLEKPIIDPETMPIDN